MALIRKEIGDLLVDNGVITPEELELVVLERSKTGETIPSILNRLGLATENALKNALELQYGVNYVPLRKYLPDPELVELLPEDVVRRHQIIPISKQGDRLTIAMVDPSDTGAVDEVKARLNGMQIKSVVCLEEEFDHFIEVAFPQELESNGSSGKSAETKTLEGSASDQSDTQPLSKPSEAPAPHPVPAKTRMAATGEHLAYTPGQSEVELVKKAQEEAIVLLANQILGGAIKRGCSNIHIIPTEKQAVVHYRFNGALIADRKLPKTILPALVARYKMMARLNLSEKVQPQDGHIKVKSSNKEIVCLMSTISTTHGEHVVIWIL